MKIDLSKEISDHLKRLKRLADDAETNSMENLSARASAMGALSSLLRDLTKSQESLINMNNIQLLQDAIVEVLEDCDPEFKDKVLEKLEERLSNL